MGKNVATLQSRSESTLELSLIVYGSLAGVRAESTVYSRRSRSRLVRKKKIHAIVRKASNHINGRPMQAISEYADLNEIAFRF